MRWAASDTVTYPFGIQETRVDHAAPVLAVVHRRRGNHFLTDTRQASLQQAQADRNAAAVVCVVAVALLEQQGKEFCKTFATGP